MKNLIIVFLVLTSFVSCEKAQEVHLQNFEVTDVRITNGPFFKAQQADIKYLLDLDADKLLAPFIREAGLKPLKESYGNWENSGLDGHIGGHYLSALSLMYASTGNKELLKRVEYMIKWLKKCQAQNNDGYVGGIPGGHKMWQDVKNGKIDAGSFSLNHKWVPLYNIHKLYAGLVDVYKFTGNKDALNILVKLSDWCIETTKNLSDAQMEDILRSEYGGLNETFVDVAEITGDEKYLTLAERFSQKAILNPLLNRKNELTGLHANTQIPKIVGFKRYADHTNNKEWMGAVNYFWDLIINEWTVSIGGNSVREHFHSPDDFSSMINSEEGPETCNTYNMLKLTKLMYLSQPEGKYIDYYEKALFNHILSSIHPEKGGFVYFTPMRPQHYRVYSQVETSFWCCVGSGLENPGKYNELIYLHDNENVYVNLFIPSNLRWQEKGIELEQKTNFPYSESSKIIIKSAPKSEFSVNIRKPDWVKNGEFIIKVNGEEVKPESSLGLYATITKEWSAGDEVIVELPMQTQIEVLPDSSNWVSFMHGPIVMAAVTDTANLDGLWSDDSRMGHIAKGKMYPIDDAPMLVGDKSSLIDKVEKIDNEPLALSIDQLIYQEKYKGLKLVPFFNVHEARYMVYWPVFSSEELESKLAEIKRNEKEMLELEEITVDKIAPGEQQPESDHNFKGERTNSGINGNKYWRDASGWFSYNLKDKNNEASKLRITYFGLDKDREFTITLNNQILDTVKLDGSKGNVFYDVDYKIPPTILSKNKDGLMHIQFNAINNKVAGGIYYIRLLKE